MTSIQQVDWAQLLLAFLHDPIDKALDIKGHESRAARYASTALDQSIGREEIKQTTGLADQLAPIAERLPMPTAGKHGERAVSPVNGKLSIRHPVSGQVDEIACESNDEVKVCRVISGIVASLETPKQRFLALWRLLPERLGREFGEWIIRLPADTRIPDHSLINHADITAGLWASRQQGAQGGAYLSFAIGPVQAFIEAARSVRDLWTGSAILSWLAFQAMEPVIDRFGPTAFVYPLLRGNALMDLWLRKHAGIGHILPKPGTDTCKCPSLPHRFAAIIPRGPDGKTADQLARQCEEAVREGWRGLAETVRAKLEPTFGELCGDWDRLWCKQIDDFFDIRTSVVPERLLDDNGIARLIGGRCFDEVWPDATAIRSLSTRIPPGDRPGYAQDTAGRWQAQMDYSARVMESNRTIRHVPFSREVTDRAHRAPAKCSLFGSWEQMGPAELSEARRFWEVASDRLRMNGVRLRKGEKFCAAALTKRFAGPAFLVGEFCLGPGNLRFPDTATVSAENWLKKAGIDPDKIRNEHEKRWNGRWLHGADDDDQVPERIEARIKDASNKFGKPPSYYAILKMDGDDIGGWLRGDNAPKLKNVLHPRIESYYREIGGPEIEAALDARRPVGPSLHAAISAALGHFASCSAPGIVRRYRGTVIYSGGDDLLALLPASHAAACADELRLAYRQGGDGSDGMGKKATISAGIAYVHYMEDLRLALQAAREAESGAKKAGKDIIRLHFMRRSGEHAGALLPWSRVGWFTELTELFGTRASNRWAYKLRSELPVLAGENMPGGAVSAEIRRIGNRIDDQCWRNHAAPRRPGDLIADWWSDYREADDSRDTSVPEALRDFVTLCQGAAFVARGRDG